MLLKRITTSVSLLLASGAALAATPLLVPSECFFKNLPADTVVLAAGGPEGVQLPFRIDDSGYPASQLDVTVHADKPVALMLSSSTPMIFNIGWTPGTRIVAVYTSGFHRQVVAGLPKGVPTRLTSRLGREPCQGGDYSSTTWLNPAAQTLFGKEVTQPFRMATKGLIAIDESTRTRGPIVTSSYMPPSRFNKPNLPKIGVAALDEAVSAGLIRKSTAEDRAALQQAIKEDALSTRKQGERPTHRTSLLNLSENSYVVLKKFQIPAGLRNGSHTFYFIVPKGTKTVTGDMANAAVYDLNTMTCTSISRFACLLAF